MILQTTAFSDWFDALRNERARARLRRLSLGNPGDVKPAAGAQA